MKKKSLCILPSLFILIILSAAGCISNSEPLQPLIWESFRYGTVNDGVYSGKNFNWQLPAGGYGCKIITARPESREQEVTLLNGPAGTRETLIITDLHSVGTNCDDLLYDTAMQELAALKTESSGLEATGLQDFENSGIKGWYFGSRMADWEMGIVVFMYRDPLRLCSYSFSQMRNPRHRSNWDSLRAKTAENLNNITFQSLTGTIFAAP